MSRTADDLVQNYLRQLEAELSALPRANRREVLDEISTHIVEARAGRTDESEAEIRTLLDRLGDPADIAAEAMDRFEVKPRKRTWVEVTALVLLPIGGVIVPIVGWLVGAILLWVSDAWTTRDKLLGTLVVPGGLLVPLVLVQTVGFSEGCSSELDADGHVLSQTCSGGPAGFERIFWPVFVICLAVATIATTVYLARRCGRARVATP